MSFLVSGSRRSHNDAAANASSGSAPRSPSTACTISSTSASSSNAKPIAFAGSSSA